MSLHEITWKLEEVTSRLAEQESRQKRQHTELSSAKEKISRLEDEIRLLNSRSPLVSNALTVLGRNKYPTGEKTEEELDHIFTDPTCRTVEWLIEDISEKRKTCEANVSIWSPIFSACGVKGMQLEFFPNGRESATLKGFCSVFFWCPDDTSMKYRLFVGKHYRAPDVDKFEGRMGHGHSNFCLLQSQIDTETDKIIVGVEILEVRGRLKLQDNLWLIRQPFPSLIHEGLGVVRNMNVNRIQWEIHDISKVVESCPREASIYSPLFAAGGIDNILLEFYPQGNANTKKEGYCALYFRCPADTSVSVTLFVGEFRKGPITVKFDCNGGKGLPEFCVLNEYIEKEKDTVVVGIEIQNKNPIATERILCI